MNFSRGLTIIASIIAGWLFLSSQFVNAENYYKDNLNIQEQLVEINISILEYRIDNTNGDVNKKALLERRLTTLEKRKSIIEDKLLAKW